jgi:hypothetical protein
MKLFLALLALAVPGAYGQSVEIVSPNKAYTFAYGDAISHQIERDHFNNETIARVAFSNYPYAGDREPRRDETFDFVFPGLRFDPGPKGICRVHPQSGADPDRRVKPEFSIHRLQARAERPDLSG